MILSQVLLSIGSLLGIIVFPVGTLSILWGIIVLAHRRRPRDERYGNLPPNG